MNFLTPEFIRAMTPIFMIGTACAITAMAIFATQTSDVKSAVFNLAGGLIAGSAGLAQAGKNESDSS